jgi:TonB family protein
MQPSVSAVLERRTRDARDGALRRALGFAAAIHAGAALVAWGGARLSAHPQKPIEYVAVQIVPAARLGVQAPRPVPPRAEPARPPEAKTEPRPESKAPVLPDPKARKEAVKRPEAKPAPAAAAPAAAEPETEGNPRGSAAALAVGAALAGLDNPNFTYGYYVDQMLSLISSNWVRPPVGSGVEATIYYRIQREGRITELRIVRSSGINSFDLAALRAIQSSSPLPPLPRGFKDGSLGVNLIVR